MSKLQRSDIPTILKTVLTLTIIASASALLIAGADLLTHDRIEENTLQKEMSMLHEYFGEPEYDGKSFKIEGVDYLSKYYVVRLDNDELSYVYRADGKNGFGEISLLAGIKEDAAIYSIRVIENGQSYASTLEDNYLKPLYKSFEESDQDKDHIAALNNVECSATNGAKLVRKLVLAAKEHYKKHFMEAAA